MSAIRISSPGLPVRGRCVVTSSPGTSTRVVIPGRCSVPVIQVADLTPGGHRRPLSPHGAGDYDRERGPRVPPLDRAPRRGARVPARLSCCRKPLVGAGRPAEGATHHGDRDSTHRTTLPREAQWRVHCSSRLHRHSTWWNSSSTCSAGFPVIDTSRDHIVQQPRPSPFRWICALRVGRRRSCPCRRRPCRRNRRSLPRAPGESGSRSCGSVPSGKAGNPRVGVCCCRCRSCTRVWC